MIAHVIKLEITFDLCYIAEKNHNDHLDELQNYKNRLISQVQELERLDRQSEFMKEWNKVAISEKKEEIKIIDRILKNLIRF